MKIKNLLFGLAIAYSLTSCAVMFQGSKKEVTVGSTVPGAEIYIDGVYAGTDSAKERLRRKYNHIVLVKKPGYNNEITEIRKHIQPGWIVFDFLVNWFAFITDPTTGAWNTFDKDRIIVNMQPVK